MLRWLLLLLLLCNALLFLWYAQRQASAPAESPSGDHRVTTLRLLHELPAGSRAGMGQRECYQLGVFASEREAEQAVRRLEGIASAVERLPAPAEVNGYQLVIEMPAGADERRELLDMLALAGWVPQTRSGRFLLGPFRGESARRDAEAEQRALQEGLGVASRLQPVRQAGSGILLQIEVPAGGRMDGPSRQLLLRGWPGIKIEKKSCSGVAQPQLDQ